MNWQLVRSFLATVEEGSLSGAARALGISQPTLSRHIKTLEADLGVQLFDRVAEGLAPTPAAGALVEDARRMREAADRFALKASGTSEQLDGTIRLTASDQVAFNILPPILVHLHRVEPGIEIELTASDSTENLLQREADIAVRMYRPTQAEIITRHIRDFEVGLFATTGYLSDHGTPTSREELLTHSLIGLDRSDLLIKGYRDLSVAITRESFAFRCDQQLVGWEMVKAGMGIGAGMVWLANRQPELVRVFPDDVGVPLPLWLTAHAELRFSRRTRRVYDFLAEALSVPETMLG